MPIIAQCPDPLSPTVTIRCEVCGTVWRWPEARRCPGCSAHGNMKVLRKRKENDGAEISA